MKLESVPHGAQVLVTGASRGIGLGMVRALLAQPQVGRVFAACRDPDAADAIQALAAEHGARLSAVALDACDEAVIGAAAQSVRLLTPRLDLLINTIGVLHDAEGLRPERKLEEVKSDDLQRSFAVNAFGPILIARHFVSLLTHEQRAVFASLSARVGSIGDNRLGGWYAYRAGKAAQNQFIRTLSVEMKRRAPHLICTVLHPGTVDTALSRPFQSGVPAGKLFDVERACAQLLTVIDRLGGEHSGRFFDWEGVEIPW